MNAKSDRPAAIVTGASSGIGKAVCDRLCGMGYEVYGFGRDFEDAQMPPFFHPVKLDLRETRALEDKVRAIRKDHTVSLLVNNAGCAYYGLHETISPAKIAEMVRVNLEVPMILSQLLLRDMKQCGGTIINIASVTADALNPHGAAYGATKAGLASFGRSLFEEARKYGLKVVTISPDMTATQLYRNADFEASDVPEARLLPGDVADAVAFVLKRPETLTVTEMKIRPQLHRIKKKR